MENPVRTKKSKRPDKRPARDRYWNYQRLRHNKIRNLMRFCGLSKEAAERRWDADRKGRMRTRAKLVSR
jgi:hypothetical protein